MSESSLPEPAFTAGLLMEGAQSQQQLAVQALNELRAHTAGLDAVVRDEIHRTLVESLSAVHAEVDRLAHQLRTVGRRTRGRALVLALAIGVAGLLPAALFQWWLPTPARIAVLEEQEARLKASLARLREQGGHVELHRCGSPERICARIDPHAPRFGAAGDFAVLAGD